jgi:hypothetical protein
MANPGRGIRERRSPTVPLPLIWAQLNINSRIVMALGLGGRAVDRGSSCSLLCCCVPATFPYVNISGIVDM